MLNLVYKNIEIGMAHLPHECYFYSIGQIIPYICLPQKWFHCWVKWKNTCIMCWYVQALVRPLQALCKYQLDHGAVRHHSRQYMIDNGLYVKQRAKLSTRLQCGDFHDAVTSKQHAPHLSASQFWYVARLRLRSRWHEYELQACTSRVFPVTRTSTHL